MTDDNCVLGYYSERYTIAPGETLNDFAKFVGNWRNVVQPTAPAEVNYSAHLIGRTGTTVHGERVKVVGPAMDPTRCKVLPLGADPSVVETFTPRVSRIVFDTPPRAR